MYGESACLMMKPESKLVIDNDHIAKIGEKGIGIIALKNNASIVLNENASLIFDGKIQYLNNDKTKHPKIILNKGSHLSFNKDAYFVMSKILDGTVDIYMNGGSVDMSQLAPQEKAKVNLIYKQQKGNYLQIFDYQPNPTQNIITFDQSSNSRTYKILDLNRQVIHSGTIIKDQYELDLSGLASGYYVLRIVDGSEIKTAKLIKI